MKINNNRHSINVCGRKGGKEKRKDIKNKQKYCPRGQEQHKALNTLSRSLECIWERQYTLN